MAGARWLVLDGLVLDGLVHDGLVHDGLVHDGLVHDGLVPRPELDPAFGEPLPQDWFARDVLDVAPELLAARMSTVVGARRVTLRITEVEAYRGAEDPGSHAFRGRTSRNAVMFGPPGVLYVYRHLGLHTCVNIVCGPPGSPQAVLLRAGEVLDGVPVARDRRIRAGVVRADTEIARGPACLAVALGIELGWNGAPVTDPGGAVVVLRPPEVNDGLPEAGAGDTGAGETGAGEPGAGEPGAVETGPRVGVGGVGGDGAVYPWRFWLAGEPTVSAYRRASPRRRPAPGRGPVAGRARAGRGTGAGTADLP